MNILFYTTTSPYGASKVGGAETSLRLIAESLASLGHAVLFVCRDSCSGLNKIQEQNVNGVKVLTFREVEVPTLGIGFLSKLRKKINEHLVFRKMPRLLAENKIEIVHTYYQLRPCLWFLNYKSRKDRNLKVVVRIAGMHWLESIRSNRRFLSLYERVFNEADKLNFISKGLFDLFVKEASDLGMKFSNSSYFIRDIGVDLSKFSQNQWELKRSGDLRIVMATRFSKNQKRQDLLVEALALLKGKIPFEAILIGDGENKEKIETLIIELGLTSQVKTVSFQGQTQLWDQLNDFDLLCHACDYEGLSKIIIESMAIGLPVLASDVRPLNEYIVDGENGFLAKNTPQGWAEKLESIFKNRELLLTISNHEKDFVSTNYDARINSKEYDNELAKI